MLLDTSIPNKTHQDLSRLIFAAIGNNASGLPEMLKALADVTAAYGCIIWEVTLQPQPLSDTAQPQGYVFALAQWFPDNHVCNFKLPLPSEIGEAILGRKSVNIEDLTENMHLFMNSQFLQQTGIRSMFAVPIILHDDAMGAISFFRTESGYFSTEEMEHIEYISTIIPTLYQSIRDKVSLNLIREVHKTLQRAEHQSAGHVALDRQMKRDFRRLSKKIAEAFHCVEVSIFLEDPYDKQGVYQLASTTWPEPITKKNYCRDTKDGLTGWVLSNVKPLLIFDLARFDDEHVSIKKEYPEIEWNDSLHIKDVINDILQTTVDRELQPLSFMAVPIAVGRKVMGVIRCCTAKIGSYHFTNREISLLRIVAGRIGQYWKNRLNWREAQEEHLSWQTLVTGIGELNEFAHDILAKGEQRDEHHVYAKTLEVIASVIKGADILDIRLLDKDRRELYFEEVYGPAWNEGTPEEVDSRKNRRFPIGNPTPNSAGEYVIQTGKTYSMMDVTKARYYSETFPKTKRMIIAPICLHGECYGLLDIRGTGNRAFPKHARAIAEMICQQLGSYMYLANTIDKLRETDTQLAAQIQIQAQVHEDLAHQLKSPIIQAYARVSSTLKDFVLDPTVKVKLQAIRGLCSKARQVTLSTELFAALARKERVEPNLSPLWYDDLIKMLIEAALDNELMANPSRRISFRVNRDTLENLPANKALAAVDHDLLQQAINNLLDNASKYSFENTVVRMSGGYNKVGHFYITVINEGLPIRPDDIQRCIQRGWRSNLASQTTGEGSGIGLWIVHHIMEAHRGELVISPTTARHLTEVRLVFPKR